MVAPSLGIGLDYGIVGERDDINVPDNGKDIIMPMISMSLPIFRGKYSAAREEAQLMQQSYLLQKFEVLNQLTARYELTGFENRETSRAYRSIWQTDCRKPPNPGTC